MHAERARTVEWVQRSRDETTLQCRAELAAAEETAQRIVASAEQRAAELADLRGRIAAQLRGTQAQLEGTLAALAPGREPQGVVAGTAVVTAPAAVAPEPPAPAIEAAPAVPAEPAPLPGAQAAPAPVEAASLPAPERREVIGAGDEPTAVEPAEPVTRPLPVSPPAADTLVLDGPPIGTTPPEPVTPEQTAPEKTAASPDRPELMPRPEPDAATQAIPEQTTLPQAPDEETPEEAAPGAAQPRDAEARRPAPRRNKRRSATGASRR
jgi:hypothetical protein